MGEELGAEWPKAIYRDGGDTLLWGEPIETSSVKDAEEEKEALASGWRLHPLRREQVKRDPLDHDGDGHKGGSLPGKRRGRPPKVKED